jgi:hypothetical protein
LPARKYFAGALVGAAGCTDGNAVIRMQLRWNREALIAKQPQTGVSGIWVICRASSALDLGERFVDPEPGPVGPVRGHRLDYIRDGQDASLQDNRVAS